MVRQIIGVKFQSRKEPDIFNGREYTYLAEDDYDVGQIIKVPTARGKGTAQVTRINIGRSELDPDINYSTIPAGYNTVLELTEKEQSIIEAWDRWESIDPGISTEQLLARVEADTSYDAGDITGTLYKRQAISKQ